MPDIWEHKETRLMAGGGEIVRAVGLHPRAPLIHIRPDSVAWLETKDATEMLIRAGYTRSEACMWLRWPMLRRVVPIFDPSGGGKPDTINFWRGWGVSPDPTGNADDFYEYVRGHVCNGSDDTFRGLLDWLAATVQRPELRPHQGLLLWDRVPLSGVGAVISRLFRPQNIVLARLRGDYVGLRARARAFENLMFVGISQFHRWERYLRSEIKSRNHLVELPRVNSWFAQSFTRVVAAPYTARPAGREDDHHWFEVNACERGRWDVSKIEVMLAGCEPRRTFGRLMHDLIGRDISDGVEMGHGIWWRKIDPRGRTLARLRSRDPEWATLLG